MATARERMAIRARELELEQSSSTSRSFRGDSSTFASASVPKERFPQLSSQMIGMPGINGGATYSADTTPVEFIQQMMYKKGGTFNVTANELCQALETVYTEFSVKLRGQS